MMFNKTNTYIQNMVYKLQYKHMREPAAKMVKCGINKECTNHLTTNHNYPYIYIEKRKW